MDKLSIFRLPILWMFIGPPAIRLQTQRSAMASVQGDADIWNIIRAVWWTFWGCAALYELMRQREHIPGFLKQTGKLPVFILMWLGMMWLSVSVSPGFLFTLASSAMFTMLVLAAADLALKIYRGVVQPRRILRALLLMSIGLTLLVYGIYLINPQSSVVVGETYTGVVRIRGRGVGYTPNLAQVIILTSLYFWLAGKRKWRPLLVGTICLGLYFIYIGQTRSSYGSFMIAIGLFAWNVLDLRHNYKRLVPLAAMGVAVIAGIAYLYGSSHRITWKVDSYYRQFVLRDAYAIQNEEMAEESLATLNGRTQAASVVLKAAVDNPIGLGYIAGLRTYMAQDHIIDQLGTDSFHGAHNSYLEVLAGTGYIGFFGYLGIIFVVIWRGRQLEGLTPLIFRLLFYIVLLQGLFESNLAFAFRQLPVQFWIAGGTLVALHARSTERQQVKSAAAVT